MNNAVASFNVDHTAMQTGLYVSRIDGDITTFDLRMRKPNSVPLLTNIQIHSFEHLLADALRSSNVAEDVIYVGPMGCQTGFYVLMRNYTLEQFKAVLLDALKKIQTYKKMIGDSLIECGNISTLSLNDGKCVAAEFLAVISD